MDNRIFNVNGKKKELLAKVLEVVFTQDGFVEQTAKSWSVDPDKGLIFYWHEGQGNKLLTPLPASAVTDMVWEWLKSDEAKAIKMVGWDRDADHDGSNSLGWRVYVEDWGHVNHNFYTICAIKPAYLWYGK